MNEVYELGCCYEVTLEDGSKVVFRAIGGAPLKVEVPPGSKNLENFDSLFTTYREIKKVPCP
jgi:hypothetical protein